MWLFFVFLQEDLISLSILPVNLMACYFQKTLSNSVMVQPFQVKTQTHSGFLHPLCLPEADTKLQGRRK